MSDLLEILSPVGDMERLHAALDYGADAVYLGGISFGMRAASAKFTPELLKEACTLAHARGKRVYLTCNILPRNNEIPQFEGFVKDAVAAGVDALIVTDLGLLSLAKKSCTTSQICISSSIIKNLYMHFLLSIGAYHHQMTFICSFLYFCFYLFL